MNDEETRRKITQAFQNYAVAEHRDWMEFTTQLIKAGIIPRDIVTLASGEVEPIPMILHCPSCGTQHIDKAAPDVCQNCGCSDSQHNAEVGICGDGNDCDCMCFTAWLNPPHRKHRCGNCNRVFQPSLLRTVGVESLEGLRGPEGAR